MTQGGRLAVARIRIMFSRFSAFYSPLIAAQAAGFLEAQGLDAEFSVAGPGISPQAGLRDGSLDLIQSAVSSSFPALERGETPDLVHFAQINQRDGFFIAGRAPDPAFAWGKLAGARVLVDHGTQPLAMFKYALHRRGVDYGALSVVDAGSPEAMQAAFRAGQGDYIHLQGPAPQQLEADGVGSRGRLSRRGDRARRVQQPVRAPGLHRDRHGARVHRRLRAGAGMGARDAGRTRRRGRSRLLQGRRTRGADAYDRRVPASGLLGRRAGDSPGCLRGRPWTCSSTAA